MRRRRRRLARHLFTLCAAASLLMCVALGALWVRGLDLRGYYVRSPRADETLAVYLDAASCANTLSVELDVERFGPAYLRGLSPDDLAAFHADRPPGLRWYVPPADVLMWLSPRDLDYRARHYVDTRWAGYRSDRWILAGPHWAPMALLLVLPAAWARRRRKARRARRLGLCPACGYDLRASPGLCPECGAERGDSE